MYIFWEDITYTVYGQVSAKKTVNIPHSTEHPMDSRGIPKEAAKDITVPRATPQENQKKKRLREFPRELIQLIWP